MPMISEYVCSAAPKPGVFVTAPERIPTIVDIGSPEIYLIAIVTPTPSMTTRTARRLSFRPPFLSEGKKPGPTCRPTA